MANNVTKDLGAVTAYAAAVAGGYTGTKAQFEALMASYASVAEAAQESAEDSEAYAIGKRDGTDVSSDDPAYHNNSKYYSQQANSLGQEQAQNAEAWANGQRGGTDVSSDDPAYHNNAEYWKDQAKDIADNIGAYVYVGSDGNLYYNEA